MNKCESGEATGEYCAGEAAETVDWMPMHLRASHQAAGNWGVYPHNGELRLHVCKECAEMLREEECAEMLREEDEAEEAFDAAFQ